MPPKKGGAAKKDTAAPSSGKAAARDGGASEGSSWLPKAALAIAVVIVSFFVKTYLEQRSDGAADPKASAGGSAAEANSLPSGWTESKDDSGQTVYHHHATGTAKYTRPTEADVIDSSDSETRRNLQQEILELQKDGVVASNESALSRKLQRLLEAQKIADLPLGELPTPQFMDWKVASQNPRIYVMDDFLTQAECEFMKAVGKTRLTPAGVVQQAGNKFDQQLTLRNNKQYWMNREDEALPVVQNMLKRVHRAAMVPETDAEAWQIGQYGVDEKYEFHWDSAPEHNVARPATLIVYLDEPEEGGYTLFPASKDGIAQCTNKMHATDEGEVFGIKNCCEKDPPGVEGMFRVAAKRGRGVLFFNHFTTGKKDDLSGHAACHILKGEKWIAQRWFRFAPYQNTWHPLDKRFDGLPSAVPPQAQPAGHLDLRVLSQKPRIYLIENFLSAEEVRHLVALAKELPAAEGGGSREKGLTRKTLPEEREVEDAVVSEIVKRMHRHARVAEANAEPLQFNEYEPQGFLGLHRDSKGTADTGRPLTMIVYLDGDGSSQEGATVFPLTSKCKVLDDCCKGPEGSAIVPPKAGRALIIGNHMLDGKLDKLSAHGACPAPAGGKLILQRFFLSTPGLSVSHPKDPRFDLQERNL
eukprot:TRINITY_DN40633_c0_g1_i1.p1 TRINITY_DN40633_c0_g1~~TRINITY_DN40633_c0_g1_i1.p1  ORF type:complete len:642 (-),score=174.99 TRINITY_DN40633_c0_g1_i1:23-1948(-)